MKVTRTLRWGYTPKTPTHSGWIWVYVTTSIDGFHIEDTTASTAIVSAREQYAALRTNGYDPYQLMGSQD
jgi:hypothetical protein